MTTRRDIEPVLDRWLAEGPTRIADRVVLGALETVDRTEQLRGSRWLRRNHPLNQTRRLAVAAALAIVIGGGALLALALRSGPNVGAIPTPTPGPSAVALYLPKMTKGVVYSVPPFAPSFTITGADGWYLIAAATPGTAFFAKGPNEPDGGPDDFALSIIQPTQVLPVGGGAPQPIPSDLIAWLQARSDLVLGTPTSTVVGGMPARAVEGTAVATAKVNQGGNINFLCAVGPCDFEFGSEFGVAPNRHFEILIVDVRGQTVAIEADTPESTWTSTRHELDDLIASIQFPG